MSKLISCQFNIDTACVDVEYEDGFVLSIYTPAVEDAVAHTGNLLGCVSRFPPIIRQNGFSLTSPPLKTKLPITASSGQSWII